MQTSPEEYTVGSQSELISLDESQRAKRTVWVEYRCFEFHLRWKERVFWWKGESSTEKST
jgi:hypothetical protein